MATIRLRKNKLGSTYQVQVRVRGQKPISATFDRRTDAKLWAEKTESDLRLGRHFTADESQKHSLGELIDRYKKDVFRELRSTAVYERTLKWWDNEYGHLALSQVTTPLIKSAWDALGKSRCFNSNQEISPRTHNSYLQSLSAVFTKAQKEYGWTTTNPVSNIKLRKLPKGRIRFLQDDELRRFLVAIKGSTNPYLKLVVLIALSTGARKTEILSLKWTDISLDEKKITFRDTKNGDSRAVPLVGATLEAFRTHSIRRAKERRFSEWVFPARKEKTRNIKKISLLWEDPYSAFERARIKAKLKDFRFHDLRHTAASHMIAEGATLAEVGKILGHRTAQMTWRYSHLVTSKVEELITKMSSRLL
jgi:integrase